jgi:nitrite reductase/ring-hydroxylating ferredoxin subunit
MDTEKLKKIKIADVKDVPLGKGIVTSYRYSEDDEIHEVALFNINGIIYALNNKCPHMEGPLGEGEVEERLVTCPWHGWQFDVTSGECVNLPGCDARKIPIAVENGEVFITL